MKISAEHVRIAIVAIESMTIAGKDAAAVSGALASFREIHAAMTAPAKPRLVEPEPAEDAPQQAQATSK